jgi:hypothetical protein
MRCAPASTEYRIVTNLLYGFWAEADGGRSPQGERHGLRPQRDTGARRQGEKDRHTILPHPLAGPLGRHLERVRLAAREGTGRRIWEGLPALSFGA